MATKSANTQGNPYHDEGNGQFTSADGGGAKQAAEEAPKKRFRFKGNLDAMRQELKAKNQVSSIPTLWSAQEIEDHLEEFFPDDVVRSIDSKFGRFSVPYKYFNLRTDPDERCGVNIFAACIGKKRWPNNYLKLIDENEYLRLSAAPGYRRLYRGIHCNNDMYDTIADSYSSKENEMIYGSVGGTAYGIAVYASNMRNEAYGYAGYDNKHIMDLVLDTNAKTIDYGRLCAIKNGFVDRRDKIIPKIEKIFTDHGIDSTKAKQMANSFGITMSDEGFVAMLCGIEWYRDSSYHMIENLGALYRYRK